MSNYLTDIHIDCTLPNVYALEFCRSVMNSKYPRQRNFFQQTVCNMWFTCDHCVDRQILWKPLKIQIAIDQVMRMYSRAKFKAVLKPQMDSEWDNKKTCKWHPIRRWIFVEKKLLLYGMRVEAHGMTLEIDVSSYRSSVEVYPYNSKYLSIINVKLYTLYVFIKKHIMENIILSRDVNLTAVFYFSFKISSFKPQWCENT